MGLMACHLQRARPPQNPATSCTGSTKQRPAPHDPLPPPWAGQWLSAPRRGGCRAPHSHLTGREDQSAGSCSGVPRPAAGSGARYGGGAAPAARSLQPRAGHGPAAHPIITFPPSKKTFHKPPRDGGNSERPRASGAAPTATRSGRAPLPRPGTRPARHRPHRTRDTRLRSSERLANPPGT